MSLYKNYTLIAKNKSMNFSDDNKLEIERAGIVEDLPGAAVGAVVGGAAGAGAAIGAGTIQELRHNRAIRPKELLKTDEDLYRSILSGNSPEDANIEQLVKNLSNSKPKNKADFFRALANSKNSNTIENFEKLILENNKGKVAKLLADSFSSAFIQKGFANEDELRQALDTLEQAATKLSSQTRPSNAGTQLLAQIYKRIANNLGNNNTGKRVEEFVQYVTSSTDPEFRKKAQGFIDHIADPDALDTRTTNRRSTPPELNKAAKKFNYEIMESTGDYAQEFKEHTFKNTRQAREQMEAARNNLEALEKRTLENARKQEAILKAEEALGDIQDKADNILGSLTSNDQIVNELNYQLNTARDNAQKYNQNIQDFRDALKAIGQGKTPSKHNAFGNIPQLIGLNTNTSLAEKWRSLLRPNLSPEQFKYALEKLEAELDVLHHQGSIDDGIYRVIKTDINNVNGFYKDLENAAKQVESLKSYQNEYNRASQAYTDAQDAYQRAQQAASPEQLEEAKQKLNQAEEELRIVSEENSKAIAAYETDPKLLKTQYEGRKYEVVKQQGRLATINEEITKTNTVLTNIESVKNETNLQQKVSKAIDEKLITEQKGKIKIGPKSFDITNIDKMDQLSLETVSKNIDQAVDAKIQELNSLKDNLSKQAVKAQQEITHAELSLRQTEDAIKRATELAKDPETKKTLQGIADIRNQVRREKSVINSAAHEVGKIPGKIGSNIKAGARRVGAGKMIAAGTLAGLAGAGYYKIKSYLNSTPEGVIDNDLRKGGSSIRFGYKLNNCKDVDNYLNSFVKIGNRPLIKTVKKALMNELPAWYSSLTLRDIDNIDAKVSNCELQYASLAIQQSGNNAVGMLKLYYKTNIIANVLVGETEKSMKYVGFDEVRVPIKANNWKAVEEVCYKSRGERYTYSDLQNSKIDWQVVSSKMQGQVATYISNAAQGDKENEFLKNCVRPIFNVQQESEFDAVWSSLSDKVRDYDNTVIENPIATFGAPTKLDCTGRKKNVAKKLFTRPFGHANGVYE